MRYFESDVTDNQIKAVHVNKLDVIEELSEWKNAEWTVLHMSRGNS